MREHIRATFVPLIRKKITFIESRIKQEEPQSVCWWKPFQVTHSERRPTITATKTPFNLVPCNRELELALTHFLDKAPDVAAFAKNAGSQSLRIDYLASGNRLAFYTPDFLVRTTDGTYSLVETKGREDRDVPLKAKAAIEWCKSASKQKTKWEYLYVPQGIFSRVSGNTIAELARACAPALSDLLSETVSPQIDMFVKHIEGEKVEVDEFIDPDLFDTLPSRYKKAIEQSILLFEFHRNKKIDSFSPLFQPLLGPLDDAAKGFIISRLGPDLPETELAQKDFFNPYYDALSSRDIEWHKKHANNLRRTLIFQNGLWPLGLLKFCLDYSENDRHSIGGIFESIKKHFKKYNGSGLLDSVNTVADFRNKFVAHQEEPLTDVDLAKNGLNAWIRGLVKIYQLRQE